MSENNPSGGKGLLASWRQSASRGLRDLFTGLSGAEAITDRELGRREALAQEIAEMQQELQELDKSLRERVTFKQITPRCPGELHKQLFENEKVHPQSSVMEMVASRVGDEFANKRAFARVVEIKGTRRTPKRQEISAGIFTAMLKVPAEDGVSYESLPGDIDAIKNMPVARFQPPAANDPRQAVVAILYTISSGRGYDWEKGGRFLAANLYDFLNQEAAERKYDIYISTLSPVRDFHRTHQGEARREDVLRYLLNEKDPVMNFHLGNGAYIGDIKFNPGHKTDPVMINYVYPPDKAMLKQCEALYRTTGMRSMAVHLYDAVKEAQPDLLSKAICLSAGSGLIPFAPRREAAPAIEAVPAPGYEELRAG